MGYTPNAGFVGIDTFTYDISDGLSLTGPDGSLFEIVQTTNGPELHLREGAILSVQDNRPLT